MSTPIRTHVSTSELLGSGSAAAPSSVSTPVNTMAIPIRTRVSLSDLLCSRSTSAPVSASASASASTSASTSAPTPVSKPKFPQAATHKSIHKGRKVLGYVKRPADAWNFDRKDKLRELVQSNPEKAGLNKVELSKTIGPLWRAETAEVKAEYERQAREERERHAAEHLEWKYQPKRKGPSPRKAREMRKAPVKRKTPGDVKRPVNSYILYWNDKFRELDATKERQGHLTKDVAVMWKEESDEVKGEYGRRAREDMVR